MVYLLIFQASNNEYAFAYNNGFMGSDNKEEALKLLPDYDSYHAVDYTWSASVGLDWLTCRQSIGEFESFEEATKFLLVPYIGTDYGKWCGSRPGIKINPELIEEFETKIIQRVKLITEEFDPVKTKPFYEK